MRVALLLFIFIFSSCIIKIGEQKKTDTNLDGIFGRSKFYLKDFSSGDIGEYLLGSSQKELIFMFENNSTQDYTDITLSFDDPNPIFKYQTNDEGGNVFPGKSGTCSESILPAGESCTVVLTYQPTFAKLYEYIVSVNFKNLIDQEKLSFPLKLLVGGPANLRLISAQKNGVDIDLSQNQSFGPFERMEPVLRDGYVYTIKNDGGLYAKQIEFSLESVHSGIFNTSTDCPTTLAPKETCSLTLSYINDNIEETDPNMIYALNHNLKYFNKPLGATSIKKTFSMKYLYSSLSIEADFKILGDKNMTFDELVNGNKQTKIFSYKNVGLRDGFLTKLCIDDASATPVAFCKASSGGEIKCYPAAGVNYCGDATSVDESLFTEMTLEELPFRFEDVNSCFDSQDPKAVNTICDMKVSFWPSLNFMTAKNFNNYNLRMQYASLWRYDEVNPVDPADPYRLREVDSLENLLIVEAKSVTPAKLKVKSVLYKSVPTTELVVSAPDDYQLFDFGDVTTLTEEYSKVIQIIIQNTGGAIANIQSLQDNASPSKASVSTSISNIHPVIYKGASYEYSCNNIPANGGECYFTLQFNPQIYDPDGAGPLGYISDPEFNSYLFDDTGLKHKIFDLVYEDQANIDDTGAPLAQAQTQLRWTLNPIKAGQLIFSDYQSGQLFLGVLPRGDVVYLEEPIRNIGTGPIDYIKLNTPNGSEFDSYYFIDEIPAWASVTTNYPGVSSCSDYADYSGTANFTDSDNYTITHINPGDPNFALQVGQECIVKIRLQASLTEFMDNTQTDSLYTSFEDKWELYSHFRMSDSDSIYSRPGRAGDTVRRIKFEYYDGLSTDKVLLEKGSEPQFRVAFFNNATLYIDEVNPIVRANIGSKSLTFPLIDDPYFPSSPEIPSVTYSGLSLFSNLGPGELNANYFDSTIMPNYSTSAYVIYAGRYKKDSGSYNMNFKILNSSMVAPVNTVLNNVNGDAEISYSPPACDVDTSTCDFVNGENFNFSFNTNGLLAGTQYRKDVDISYQDRPDTVLANRPNFLMDVSNLDLFGNVVQSTSQNVSFTVTVVFEVDEAPQYELEFDSKSGVGGIDNENNYNLNSHYSGLPASYTIEAIKGVVSPFTVNFKLNHTASVVTPGQNLKVEWASSPVGTYLGKNVADYLLDTSDCDGDPVTALGSCNITLDYRPTDFAVPETRYLIVSNLIGDPNDGVWDKQYIRLDFSPIQPAIVNPTPTVVNLQETLGTGENSWQLLMGNMQVSLNLGGYDRFWYNGGSSFELVNSEGRNASFLVYNGDHAAFGYQAYTAVGGGWYELPMNDNIYIQINQKCLDGFNSSDPSGSGCLVKFYYQAIKSNFGKDISSSINTQKIKLRYYNNLDDCSNTLACTSEITFHIRGFIKGPVSTGPNPVENVLSEANGDLSFSWQDFSPSLPGFGGITSYRVYYGNNALQFSQNSIYDFSSPGLSYVNVEVTDKFVDLNNLEVGRYKYFKIMAEIDGSFISENPSMGIKSILVPPTGWVYLHDDLLLIKNDYKDEAMTRDEAFDYCSLSDSVAITSQAGTTSYPLELINTSLWETIRTHPKISDTYPNTYPVANVPHWLSDPLVNISAVFAAEPSFDANKSNDFFPNFNTYGGGYRQDCNNGACNPNLPKIVGGDGVDFPVDGEFYINEDTLAYARCYLDLTGI